MAASIVISDIEVLALKKLVLINHALAQSLRDEHSRMEQMALFRVLNDVTLRADIANQGKRADRK